MGQGTQLADLHLPVRINGDIALLKGLMKTLLAEDDANGGVIDHTFIQEYTDGFAELYADLQATTGRRSSTAAESHGRRSSARER